MAKKSGFRETKADEFIVGREAFAKVSEVEGLKMPRSMRKDFEEFDRKKLPAAERRKALAAKYGKKR